MTDSDGESWKPSESDESMEDVTETRKTHKRKAESKQSEKPCKKVKVSLDAAPGNNNLQKDQAVENCEESGSKKVFAHKERRKFSCPLLACRSNVTHLPRHMRSVHKWTKEAAAKVTSKYNIRKRKPRNEGAAKKDYHLRHRCAVPGCHSIVYRMAVHLQKVHKMEKSSNEYMNAIDAARIVGDVKHPLLRLKEEHLKRTTTPQANWHDHDKGTKASGASEQPWQRTSVDLAENISSSDDQFEDTNGPFDSVQESPEKLTTDNVHPTLSLENLKIGCDHQMGENEMRKQSCNTAHSCGTC